MIDKKGVTVDSFSEMKKTTEDKVVVLKDDGHYGSGYEVTYRKSPYPLYIGAYKRENGDFMIPEPSAEIPPSNSPMYAIGNVVASYVVRSDLVYGQEGAFSPKEVEKEIDCSTFACLVMQGITYENSRYNGLSENKVGFYFAENIPLNQGSLTSDRLAYKAHEMAKIGRAHV